MTLEDTTIANMTHQVNSGITQMANSNIQMNISGPAMPLLMNSVQQMPTSMSIQNVGIPNQALNSSLGLPIGQGTGINNGMVLPMQGNMPVMQNSGLNTIGTMPTQGVIGGFQPSNGVPVMPTPNMVNNSLFMGQSNATVSFHVLIFLLLFFSRGFVVSIYCCKLMSFRRSTFNEYIVN